MNNPLLPQQSYRGLPPAVLPRTTVVSLLDILPIGLIVLCLVIAFITFLIHKRSAKIGMFIPISMLIISVIFVFLILVPLPFKKICDYSTIDGAMTDCVSINMTGWKRFLEITTFTDNRSIVPRVRGGIFPANSTY